MRPMLYKKLEDLPDTCVLSLLEELEQLTSTSIEGHKGYDVFSFLRLCCYDRLKMKRKPLNASKFYKGSTLKSRVQALESQETASLLAQLCQHFKVHSGLIQNMLVYKAIDDLLNEKSQLRKKRAFNPYG